MYHRAFWFRCRIAILFLFFILFSLHAQSGSPESESGSVLYPEPVPFSLDSLSAIYCIDLLKEAPFIEVKDGAGNSSHIRVETVWSYFLHYDEVYPEGHRLRYDIIVNGEPLDWENSFIEYGGEMLNLHLLFLYRNQHPGKNLEFHRIP